MLWYELDTGAQAHIEPYDEGGRLWAEPKSVQALQAILTEGEQQFLTTGSYQVARLHLELNYEEMRRKGISQPVNRGAHLQDRVGFDGRLFSVDDYQPMGRLADTVLTLSVECTEVKDDEMQTDALDWVAP